MNGYVKRLVDQFTSAYGRLAQLGHCDDPHGMEYARVIDEWFKADCPPPVRFIRRRANINPDGEEPTVRIG